MESFQCNFKIQPIYTVIKTYLNLLYELDNFVTYHFNLTDSYCVIPKEVALEFEAKYDNKIYFTAAIFRTPTND